MTINSTCEKMNMITSAKNLHDVYLTTKRIMKVIDKPLCIAGTLDPRTQRERFQNKYPENTLMLSSQLVSEHDNVKEYLEYHLTRSGLGLEVQRFLTPNQDGTIAVDSVVSSCDLSDIVEAVGMANIRETVCHIVETAMESALHKADNLEYALKRLEEM